MTFDLFVEILGTIVGIIYLYYEYRASKYLWIAGIIMPAISLFVYWRAGLYADFGINVYYLLVAIYGWIAWQYRRTENNRLQKEEKPIIVTPRKAWLPLFTIFVILFVVIGYILDNCTDSTVPWWDSYTTALSIVGMLMLARKWIEQWFVWIAVDVVCSFLYIYKDIYFYSALYAAYSVIAVFGYFEWKKKMSQSVSTPLS